MGKGEYVTPQLPTKLYDTTAAGDICDPAAAGLRVGSSSITLRGRQALTWLL
jgi:hypothetical protein